jgi:hypothetical protein
LCGALVVGQDRDTNAARSHPEFVAFCRNWVSTYGCATLPRKDQGTKTESGVGLREPKLAYRANGGSRRCWEHLERWMLDADRRIHGTTHERPCNDSTASVAAADRPTQTGPRSPGLAAYRHRLLRLSGDT